MKLDKQLIFKENYILKLKMEIDVDKYKSIDFVYDKNQVLMMPNINKPGGLSSRLSHQNDFEAAVALFEAFKNLEPIQAADQRLWTYLTHVDLYPYMIKRWSSVYDGTAINPERYIHDHWFLESSVQSNLLRHAISGLWWSVYLSVDESRGESRYELTKILFRQLDFATRTLGTYKLGRHKEAVIGILEFIQENETLFYNNFEGKVRFLTKHLNLLGGVKPIAFYDRFFFKMELKKVESVIKEI